MHGLEILSTSYAGLRGPHQQYYDWGWSGGEDYWSGVGWSTEQVLLIKVELESEKVQ